MTQDDIQSLPKRIVGLQRLEALFNQNGYLLCQSSGERISDINELVAIFLPIDLSTDNVVAVRSDYAPDFIQKCIQASRSYPE